MVYIIEKCDLTNALKASCDFFLFLPSLHKYFNWDSRWFSSSLCHFCYTIGNSNKFTSIIVNIY